MKHWSTGTAVRIKSLDNPQMNIRQRVSFRRADGISATLYAWEDGTAVIESDHPDPVSGTPSIHEEQTANMAEAMKRLDQFDA